MSNIYDKPIGVELQPLDWDFLAKTKMYGAEKKAKADAALDDLAQQGILRGGLSTKDAAQKLNQQTLTDLANFRDRIMTKGEDPVKIGYQVKSYANRLAARPDFQAIKSDESAAPGIEKIRLDQQFPDLVQGFYNKSHQEYNQVPLEELQTGKWNVGTHYSFVEPDSENKGFQPYYSRIKANITKQYDPETYDYAPTGDGSFAVVRKQDGKQVDVIDKDRVKNMALDLLQGNQEKGYPADPNFNSLQSFKYADALHQQNFNTSLTPDDKADIFSNAFMGDYRHELETQPKTSIVPNKGGGFGGAKKTSELYNPVTHDLMQAAVHGQTAIQDPNKASTYLGSTPPNDKGVFKVNLSGYSPSEKIIALSSLAGESPAESDNKNTSQAIKLKAQFNQVFKEALEKAGSSEHAIVTPGSYIGLPWAPKPTWGNIHRFYSKLDDINYSLNGPEGLNFASELLQSGDLAKSEADRMNLKTKSLVLNDPRYKRISSEAKSLGINLFDPKLTKGINSLAPEDLEAFETFSNTVNMTGISDATLAPGDNLIVGNDKKPYLKVFVNKELKDYNNIKASQLTDWVKKGIVYSGEPKTTDGKQIPTIDVPMYLPVKGNLGAITESMARKAMTKGDMVEKDIPALVSESNQFGRNLQSLPYIKAQVKNLSSQNKLSTEDLGHINKIFEEIQNSENPQESAQLLYNLSNELNSVK